MSDVWAVVGTVAVLAIPVFAWLSRRATREGRLLLRVERLGTAYTLMPDSDERGVFEQHLRRAVSDLNEWIDTDNRARRNLVRLISVVAYVVGVSGVVAAVPILGTGSAAMTALGIGVGFAIALIGYGSSWLLERSAKRRGAAAAQASTAAVETARLEALRRGEHPSANL